MSRFGATWQRMLMALGAAGAALVVILLGAGWYYSDQIWDGALRVEHEPPEYDLQVAALGEATVTLTHPGGEGKWTQQGLLGLEWDGGYARVGKLLEASGDSVTRDFEPLDGAPAIGDPARLDRAAFPEDPLAAHGLDFSEVTYTSPVGELGAWWLEGTRDTWVIYVHGRGSNRKEALRALPVGAALGLNQLVIDYRNDEGAPPGPTGRYQFGRTEWRDVEGAVLYAVEHGAGRVVLFGYSMGGGLVLNFLLESPLAPHVAGVVLDAPLLDLGASVDLGAQQRGLPGILTATAKFLAAQRFGMDWAALDLLHRADELETPILLFHGDEDGTVPVWTSDALAEERPDLVTYVRIAGADHVASWNVGPDAYEGALRGFLAAVAP